MGHLFDSYRDPADDVMIRVICPSDPDPEKIIYYMEENSCLRAGRAFFKNFYMYLQYNYLREGDIAPDVHQETLRRLRPFIEGDFSVLIYKRRFLLKELGQKKVLKYELAHRI